MQSPVSVFCAHLHPSPVVFSQANAWPLHKHLSREKGEGHRRKQPAIIETTSSILRDDNKAKQRHETKQGHRYTKVYILLAFLIFFEEPFDALPAQCSLTVTLTADAYYLRRSFWNSKRPRQQLQKYRTVSRYEQQKLRYVRYYRTTVEIINNIQSKSKNTTHVKDMYPQWRYLQLNISSILQQILPCSAKDKRGCFAHIGLNRL